MFSHCYDNHPPRDLHFHLWSVLKQGTKMREQGMNHSAPNFTLWPIYYIRIIYATALHSRRLHTTVEHMTALHIKAKHVTALHTKPLHTSTLHTKVLQ